MDSHSNGGGQPNTILLGHGTLDNIRIIITVTCDSSGGSSDSAGGVGASGDGAGTSGDGDGASGDGAGASGDSAGVFSDGCEGVWRGEGILDQGL